MACLSKMSNVLSVGVGGGVGVEVVFVHHQERWRKGELHVMFKIAARPAIVRWRACPEPARHCISTIFIFTNSLG